MFPCDHSLQAQAREEAPTPFSPTRSTLESMDYIEASVKDSSTAHVFAMIF